MRGDGARPIHHTASFWDMPGSAPNGRDQVSRSHITIGRGSTAVVVLAWASYSALMLAALIMGVHFSISVL